MMVSCLVVDDDRKILDYVKSHLINEHFETHAFLSGEEALHFLEKENVDIAIVGIMTVSYTHLTLPTNREV